MPQDNMYGQMHFSRLQEELAKKLTWNVADGQTEAKMVFPNFSLWHINKFLEKVKKEEKGALIAYEKCPVKTSLYLLIGVK